jgi:hypothetical protein
MRVAKYQVKKKVKSDRGGPVKLPNLTSAYLRHPSEGMGGMIKRKPLRGKKRETPNSKMCGLCGAMHAPGEAHHAKPASYFNVKTGGIVRIQGGYIAPPGVVNKRGSNGSSTNRHSI